MRCEFCESLENCKGIESKSEILKEGFYYDYRVQYVSVAMKEGHDRGYSVSKFFEMNYCPMCGKRLSFE